MNMIRDYSRSHQVLHKPQQQERILCVITLLATEATVQCIAIGPVSVFVGVFVCGSVTICLWVCYHDNSKLRASILTKLGL